MEVIKRILPVEEAKGWHLLQNEIRTWVEKFEDGETGKVVNVERNEVLLRKGLMLNELDVLTLKDNGITTVSVSNVPLIGSKQEYMSLWEASLTVITKFGERKRTYIVTAESPTAAEAFISGYMEANVECTFEAVKVSRLSYGKVVKPYEAELEAHEAEGRCARWYKAQVFAALGEELSPAVNVLVQAMSFEAAINAIKTVERNKTVNTYYVFKSMQELNVAEVFIPDGAVSYYSISGREMAAKAVVSPEEEDEEPIKNNGNEA
jgi:hypothetical protein